MNAAGIVVRSLVRSGSRATWALGSLLLSGAIIASVLGVQARVESRASRELARFGPNVMLRPADVGAREMPAAWLDAAWLRDAGVESAVAEVGGDATLVADAAPGTSSASLRVVAYVPLLAAGDAPTWWASPSAEQFAMSAEAAARAKLVPGARVRVSMADDARAVDLVVARDATGALPEGVDAMVDAASGRQLGLGHAAFRSVAVRVAAHDIERFVAAVRQQRPGVSAEPVRRVAFTERQVLRRTGAFVAGLAAVLVGLCGLCFATTLFAQWTERAPEIALMRALGAPRRRVMALAVLELATLGVAGGLGGGLVGSLLGRVVLVRGFGWDAADLGWPWWTFCAAVVATTALAVASGVFPSWRAAQSQPTLAMER